MNTSKRNVALLVLGLASSLALGQNADMNGAGPTRNDYRLRVIEPAEGATIAGPRVQVSVNLEIPGQPADERRNGNTMPQPSVVVFLDDERRGDLKDLDNVLTLDDVTPGKHSIKLLAMNKAGEVIDRKVIRFESTPASAAVAENRLRPMPASNPSSEREREPVLQPAAMPKAEPVAKPAEPILPTETSADRASGRALPKTGTGYPLAAAAGLALVVTGLVLRRRA